ncbi:hypothetical protein [Sphaerisporangium perillae]|uniref:hypothetical protein n=1 Tax=Sphaerisporangium perillae TaxID=2935860 RepID=UPI00200D5DE3|nr:hypothetical protein [Sphaerisporangium perillae]
MGVERIPYLLGHSEIARLFDVAPDTPQLWRKRALLGDPDVVISGKPYWLLSTVLALAKPGQRDVPPGRLDEYKASIPNGYFAQVLAEPPSLIGIKELAWIFGKKHTDISQWRNRGTLAPPDLTLSGAPLWLLDTILLDAERRNRTIAAEALESVRRGDREQIKPRGQRDALVRDSDETLSTARTFTNSESAAAIVFVRHLFRAGYEVEVRPYRSNASSRPTNQLPSQNGEDADKA